MSSFLPLVDAHQRKPRAGRRPALGEERRDLGLDPRLQPVRRSFQSHSLDVTRNFGNVDG
jgi:hypothetical protein